jgi:uncharacterized protein YdhG (YjbR/CyaY superfamily)
MVQSKARSVDEYLAGLPEERRAPVERMREIARRRLKGFEEGMEYGMPCYRRSPDGMVAFASQRQHVALYPGAAVLTALQKELTGLDVGKGCIRFARPEQIDWTLVERVFAAAGRS